MMLTPLPSNMNPNMNRRTIALLAGFCFFLSALEYVVPKPLPFIRLGLANLPLLLALDILPFSSFLLLAALKVMGQALISGTLFSYVFLFSLGGTGASVLLMYALRKNLGKEKISLTGVSAAGALASNVVTLFLARHFVFGESVIYAAAPLLALGLVTGTILGASAEYFIRNSAWYTQNSLRKIYHEECAGTFVHEMNNSAAAPPARGLAPLRETSFKNRFQKARETFYNKTFNAGELAAAGLCMMPALLLNPDTNTRIVQFLFFLLLAWLSGKRIRPLLTFSVMAGIIFFNLLVPYGELLLSIGPLAVTSGALMGGIRRAVTLAGLIMLSRFCVRQDLALPGSFGELTKESLRIFSGLAEEKKMFTLKNWRRRLDELLFAYSKSETAEPGEAPGHSQVTGRTPGRAFISKIILAALIILAWLPFLRPLLMA